MLAEPMVLQPSDEGLLQHNRANCHAPNEVCLVKVEPIEDWGTKGERLQDFSPKLFARLNCPETNAWKGRNSKMQHGYVNNPLGSLKLRALWLHHGPAGDPEPRSE